jgi:predicted MFS family arabinose efflux permease
MAVISLSAMLGPVLGTLADRYHAHRLILCGGVLGMAVGFAAFALSAESTSFYALDAIVLGVSISAVSAIGPVLIVGARLSRDLEARRMTMYSLAMPAGQVAGGVLVGAAGAASWSFSARVWMAAGMIAVRLVATVLTTADPVRSQHDAMDRSVVDSPNSSAKPARLSLRTVLWSTFGIFLLVTVLSSLAVNGINSQISNIMPKVYGLSDAETSTLISAAGVLNIALFLPAGKLMARRGATAVYSVGVTMRLFGAAGMAVVGLVSGAPALLGVAMMQLLYQSNPFARLAQPGTAVVFARVPAGIANGWLIAGSALGSAVGSAWGGVLADRYGFNAVNWMGAGAAAASVAVLFVGLWPRRPPAAEERPGAPPPSIAPVTS